MPSLLDANRKIKAYTRAREHMILPRIMKRKGDLSFGILYTLTAQWD